MGLMYSWGVNVVTLQPTVTFPYKIWVFQWKPVQRMLVLKKKKFNSSSSVKQSICHSNCILAIMGLQVIKFNSVNNGTQIIWEGTKLLDPLTLAS
jgi:hypothetical protein